REKARGIVERGWPVSKPDLPFVREYLRRRGCGIPERYIRVVAAVPYWHGKDEGGRAVELYSGPAMVAPFVAPSDDGTWQLIGCHITWIDLDNPPKFRPALFGLTDKGREAGLAQWRYGDRRPSAEQIAAELYEALPTKKMR